MTPTVNESAALAEIEWELSAPHTLEAIATRTGMTLRAVHRIEKRALKKMRAAVVGDWVGGLHEPSLLGRRLDAAVSTTGAATTPWSDGGHHDGSRS